MIRLNMIRLIIGLIIAMFGVGGTESSTSDLELFQTALVSAFGVLVMWSGVEFVKVGEK